VTLSCSHVGGHERERVGGQPRRKPGAAGGRHAGSRSALPLFDTLRFYCDHFARAEWPVSLRRQGAADREGGVSERIEPPSAIKMLVASSSAGCLIGKGEPREGEASAPQAISSVS
jgi:hypothetical protein